MHPNQGYFYNIFCGIEFDLSYVAQLLLSVLWSTDSMLKIKKGFESWIQIWAGGSQFISLNSVPAFVLPQIDFYRFLHQIFY